MLPLRPKLSRPGLWFPGDKEARETFGCFSMWVVGAVAGKMDGRKRLGAEAQGLGNEGEKHVQLLRMKGSTLS